MPPAKTSKNTSRTPRSRKPSIPKTPLAEKARAEKVRVEEVTPERVTMPPPPASKKPSSLTTLQMVFEGLVLFGYVVGLIPFGYIFALFWVIPLTIANLIISLIQNNATKAYTITNVVMAWLSLIPIVGYVPRIIGIIMSVLSMIKLMKS